MEVNDSSTSPPLPSPPPNDNGRVAILGFIIGGMLALIAFSTILGIGYWVYTSCRNWWRGRRREGQQTRGRQRPRLRRPDRDRVVQILLAALSSLWGFGTMVEERGRHGQHEAAAAHGPYP